MVPIPVDSIFCGACDGYVHPFLDACPSCGATRESRLDAALADPDLGFRALLTEPRVTDRVRETVLRYSLKAVGGSAGDEVRNGFGTVAGALQYTVRSGGAIQGASAGAFVHLAGDDLVVGERNPAREVVRVPLAAILATRSATKGRPAAVAWGGPAASRLPEGSPLPAVAGDLVVTLAGPAGLGRVGIGNPRGIFAARARADHYFVVARWLGILAAAAAEARWIAVGPATHARELGLAEPGAAGAAGTAAPAALEPGSSAVSPAGAVLAGAVLTGAAGAVPAGVGGPASGGASVGDALATLEELRVRGLVTDAEYAAKRSEILARL